MIQSQKPSSSVTASEQKGQDFRSEQISIRLVSLPRIDDDDEMSEESEPMKKNKKQQNKPEQTEVLAVFLNIGRDREKY